MGPSSQPTRPPHSVVPPATNSVEPPTTNSVEPPATSSVEPPAIVWPLLIAAAVVIVILGLHQFATVAGQALLAYFIALGLTPGVHWLRRRHLPTALAVVLVMLVVLAVVVSFIVFTTFTLTRMLAETGALRADYASVLDRASQWLAQQGIASGSLTSVFSPERVFAFVSRVLEWLLTSLSYSFLLFFVLLYMLLDSVNLQPRLARHLDRDGFSRLLRFQHLIRRYWAIQTVTGIVAAALDVALLLALGVPFAVFLGILSFVTNYIPNVGYFIAIIPALFLAAIVKGWVAAVVVFLGYWLFNTIAGSVLAPRLNATHLNLSYTTTMVAVLFWGWVFGPVGGLIAVPLTLFLKDVLLASHAEADWLVDLLSSEAPAE